jgi:hypothetical protein
MHPLPATPTFQKRPVSFKNYYLCLLWLEARKRVRLATSKALSCAIGFCRNDGRKRHLRIEEKCNYEGKKRCGKNRDTMKRQKLKKKREKYMYQEETVWEGGGEVWTENVENFTDRKGGEKRRKEREMRLLSYKYKCVV